jgi:apolipoprotein N-acyltransferase
MRERARAAIRAKAAHAAFGGLLLAVSAPPFPAALIFLAFVAVVLLASALDGATIRQAAVRGLFFGLFTNLVAMSFVPSTITRFTDLPLAAALLGWVLLSLGQGALWSVAGAITGLGQRLRVPLPLAFGLGVGVSMITPSLFPWTIAAPFARAPMFLQIAELIGERGVAVVLAVSAGLLVIGVRRERRLIFAAAAMLGALPLYGIARWSMVARELDAAPRRSVALIQQAVPPKERWKSDLAPSIVTKLWSLTRLAEDQGAELAIWPESAYPYVLPHGGGRDGGAFRIRGSGIRVEVITGLLTDAPPPEDSEVNARWHYNATTIATVDGAVAPAAAKLELLAFGEVVPLGNRIPVLRRIFARGGGLVEGTEPVLLTTKSPGPTVRAGVLNCYEDTLPGVSRRVVNAGPNLLVNVTNDAWFGASSEPELHMLESIPRAIEARRDLVRAVNTGVTAHIDALGRVVARAPREVATVLMTRPALLETSPTAYVRFGDATWISLLLVASMASRRRPQP